MHCSNNVVRVGRIWKEDDIEDAWESALVGEEDTTRVDGVGSL